MVREAPRGKQEEAPHTGLMAGEVGKLSRDKARCSGLCQGEWEESLDMVSTGQGRWVKCACVPAEVQQVLQKAQALDHLQAPSSPPNLCSSRP